MRKQKFNINREEIYNAFPSHTPNRPIFEPRERDYFGSEDETVRAESLLSVSRELIEWIKFDNINLEASSSVIWFSENFYKDVFPSLLCFAVFSESILQSGGYHYLAATFVDNHLDVDYVKKDWEIDFILSMNEVQSRVTAKVVANCEYGDALENHWFKFLP